MCFITQACNGLVDQIEKGELNSRVTAELVERYVAPLLKQNVDTLVLGCTHYPFVQPLIDQVAKSAGHSVIQVDTGEPVAKQLQRLLVQHSLLREASATPAEILAFTSGSRTVGRVQDCDSCCRGFEPHRSPHSIYLAMPDLPRSGIFVSRPAAC